jgi:hypothetical protein
MPVFENRGGYLFVEVTEPYSLKVMKSIIQQIADICGEEDLDKVLVDLRTIDETISIMDRYEVGVEVAKIIGPKVKVAGVAQKALINYMAETVAVNRYGKLKVFSDMDKATEWLGIGE